LNTLSKFRFQDLLIKEYEHWYLLLRYEQPTLGSLILITKHNETSYSEMEENSFTEFSRIIKDIEPTLRSHFNCSKFNYLMLMMVDPEVHYHIIPRYSKNILFEGKLFKDFGWPYAPSFSQINKIDSSLEKKLLEELISCFKRG
jgi:diadenosine tetraphosphate (Ap4A) HIT family hydrolase